MPEFELVSELEPVHLSTKYFLCRFRARARARARARSRLHFFATHLSIRSITHAAERRRHSNLVCNNYTIEEAGDTNPRKFVLDQDTEKHAHILTMVENI